MSSPNPLIAAWNIFRATRRPMPQPTGTGTVEHAGFAPVLEAVGASGISALDGVRSDLASYLGHLAEAEPTALSRSEALAFWINLYNASALELVADAAAGGHGSVLDVKHAFERSTVTIAAEDLSLQVIEHGIIRRFGDPRIHASLVCGSASCPTLRREPFEGSHLDTQLDDQIRSFLAAGGAVADRNAGTIHLSRVFKWYGADFVRPHRMPAWIPARRTSILRSIEGWLDGETRGWVDRETPGVAFQAYDWGLGCSVG